MEGIIPVAEVLEAGGVEGEREKFKEQMRTGRQMDPGTSLQNPGTYYDY
jgi:hypothetical protein